MIANIQNPYRFGAGGDIPTGNLLAYYRLESESGVPDVIDEQGYDDLASFGSIVSGGKPNNCFDFSGSTSDRLESTNTNLFSFTDGFTDLPFSVTGYYKWANTGSQMLFNKRNSTSGNQEYQFFWFSGDLYFQCLKLGLPNANISANITSFTPTVDVWYHVGMTYDGSESNTGIEIYIDGVQQSLTRTSSGTYTGMQTGTSPFMIGRAGWTTTFSWDDLIDSVGVWDIELTPTQMTAVYDEQNAGNDLA